jgi:competence protein ComEA
MRCLLSLLFFSVASHSALAQKNPPKQPVNINTATIAQLETLPGIGPTTAKSIVNFREKSGPFQSVEDLLAIKGISKTKLEKLRPYVTIGPPKPKQQSNGPHQAFLPSLHLIFRKPCDSTGARS